MSEQKSNKKTSIGSILSWIFGVLFALIGIVSVFSDPIPGLIMLIMAAVLLPPVVKLIEQKSNFKLTRGIKAVVLIIGFIVFGATVDTSTTTLNQPQNNQGVVESSDQNNAEVKEEQPQTENKEQADNEEKTETIPVLFDVPALLDKNISYFSSEFGQPVNDNPEPPEPTDIEVELGIETTEWSRRYQKGKHTISVYYNLNSGEVTKIFLSNLDISIPKSNIEELLQRGNISKKNGYYFRFYKVPDENSYTGVEVQKEPFTGFKGAQLCNGYPEC